ncbi:MAG: hypothetical protein IKY68_00235 [Alistipes sp.]|nr:hypothetical protein [Alistipes sp.]
MLIRIIEHYLESHKRLIIPQLGAFLVKEEPRVVVFSELLRRDDGVLQGLLVAEGMSEVAARGEVDRLVYEVRHAIEHGERYYLSDFGEFYPGKQGTILFEYHQRLSFVPESPVDMIPDLIEKVRPEVKPVERVAPMQPVVDKAVVEPTPKAEVKEMLYIPELDEEDLTLDGCDEEFEEEVETVTEDELLASEEQDEVVEPRPTATQRPRRPAPQAKKRPDIFLWVAITAGVIALAAIAFGLYNETMNGSEEEQEEYYESLYDAAELDDSFGAMNE